MRCQAHVSPAGAPQKLEERNAWRQYFEAAQREKDAAKVEQHREEQRGRLFRFMRKPRCGSCATCLELKGGKHRASAPCETVLSRLEYTESERAIVCDPERRYFCAA